jgi:glycosyltransferase involved in cell wall biosynthesis
MLVSDHYPPFIGGAHRQTHLLGKELQRRGHTVSVVTAWQPGLPAEQRDDGVPVYHIKELRTAFPRFIKDRRQRHHPPYPDPVTIWGLRRVIEQFRPDVVHSHGWFSYSCAAALVGKQIPLLLSVRDYGYSCATRTLLNHNRLCSGPELLKCVQCAKDFYGVPKGIVAALTISLGRALLVRKTRGMHSVSSFVQQTMQRDFVRGQTPAGGTIIQRVIPSFLIETEPDPCDPRFLDQLPAEPYFLFVGGLQPRKGLGALLAAYEQLQSPPPLVLIGYRTADMPKTFPPGVTVLYDAPHANVMVAWERCLFGVMPSVWPDPSPGVVREAMKKGKAVVGTAIGGTTEMIVDGVTGLLVPPDDIAALAGAMQRLIDDTELCRRFGEAAEKRANMYMADVVVPRFVQLYEQLISATAKTSTRQDKDGVTDMRNRQQIPELPPGDEVMK